MNHSNGHSEAWLETAAGENFPLRGNCSFGRSSENTIKIVSEKASRRHATIHTQDVGDVWLIDLGSVNGTLLNGSRISSPIRLKDGDRISIAGAHFLFRQTAAHIPEEVTTDETMATLPEVQTTPCWLLLADIADFTTLSQQLDPQTLAIRIGKWVRKGKEIIEKHGGIINKYLGDGYMAFWRDEQNTATRIAAAATLLREVQSNSDLTFRVAIHFGEVAIGGSASHGEECLMGAEVNFVFRMEKLAADLKKPFFLSSPAGDNLRDLLAIQPVPDRHALKGFTGEYSFFAL